MTLQGGKMGDPHPGSAHLASRCPSVRSTRAPTPRTQLYRPLEREGERGGDQGAERQRGSLSPTQPPNRQEQREQCQRGTEGGRGAWQWVRCSKHPGIAVATLGGAVGTTAPSMDLPLPEGQEQGSRTRNPQKDISGRRSRSQRCAQHRIPAELPRDMQVREPLGRAGSPYGHAGGTPPPPGPRAGRRREGIPFSPSRKPPRPADRVPAPPEREGARGLEGGGSSAGSACKTSLQLPSKTSQQLGRRHSQLLRPERRGAASHRSDPGTARRDSAHVRPDPHPELMGVPGAPVPRWHLRTPPG